MPVYDVSLAGTEREIREIYDVSVAGRAMQTHEIWDVNLAGTQKLIYSAIPDYIFRNGSFAAGLGQSLSSISLGNYSGFTYRQLRMAVGASDLGGSWTSVTGQIRGVDLSGVSRLLFSGRVEALGSNHQVRARVQFSVGSGNTGYINSPQGNGLSGGLITNFSNRVLNVPTNSGVANITFSLGAWGEMGSGAYGAQGTVWVGTILCE